MIDEFTSYEIGASRLLKALRELPESQSKYQYACLLQIRLQENITRARIRGRDSSQKADLNEILEQWIDLSLHTTGKSFNEWCVEEHVPIKPPVNLTPPTPSTPSIMLPVSSYIRKIYHNLQRVHKLFSGTDKIYQFECEDAIQMLQELTLSINVINTTFSVEMTAPTHHIQHCITEIIKQINIFSSHCEKQPTSRQRYLLLEKLNNILRYMEQHKAISIHIEA